MPVDALVSQPTQSLATVRVMVADDGDLYRAGMVRAILLHPELELTGEATDGLEAVELAVRMAPDIALLDLHMPHLDGAEVCRRLLAHEPALPTRCILLSAAPPHDAARHARDSGALAFLTKSASRLAICSTVARLGRTPARPL